MKKLTLLKGSRVLLFTALVSFSSLAATAQTKAKAPATATTQKTQKTSTTSKPVAKTAATSTKAPVKAASKTTKVTATTPVKKAAPAKPVEQLATTSPVKESVAEVASAPAVAPKETKRKPASAFEGGTNVVGLGFGLVDDLKFSQLSGASKLKPLTLSYERGLNIEAGPGVIGVGGTLSYAHLKWSDDSKYSFMYIAAKAAYHYNFTQNSNLDTYAGLTLGYANVKASWSDSYYYNGGDTSDGEVKVGLLAGARYFFTEQFGGHLEFETGPISNITIGVNYRF